MPTDAEKRVIWSHLRRPAITFACLLGGLAVIVLLGALMPGRLASYLEAGVAIGMILTVLLVSMEVLEDLPLMRFYSALGFCWLAILFGMTMVDYLTR